MASARENIAALVGEQKKLRKEKVYGAWGRRAGDEEAEGWEEGDPASSGHKSWVSRSLHLCVRHTSHL